MKKYYFFDKGTIIFMIIGFLVFHFVGVYACYQFYQTFVGTARWGLIAFVSAIVVSLDLMLLLSGFIRDFLSCHSFDAQGIHCFNLQWGRYIIPWDSIRTYGVFFVSVSYMRTAQAFFSQNPKEPAPKTMKERGARHKDRIVVNLSPEIWAELERYMPADMKQRMNDTVDHHRGIFIRR